MTRFTFPLFDKSHTGRLIAASIAFLLASAFLHGCSQRPQQGADFEQRPALGTVVTVKAYDQAGRVAGKQDRDAFTSIRQVEGQTNNYSSKSAISHVNNRAGRWQNTPILVGDAIELALRGAKLTDGTYDPTVWPLVKLWAFGRGGHVPERDELAKALALTGWRKVRMEPGEPRVSLPEGMSFDLGGMAKGMAVDMAVANIQHIGHALVTAGSTTAVYGGRPNGKPWRIGIENPRKPGKLIATVLLMEGSVSTSGDYQNYFVRDGIRYHHILDPKTGMPARGTMSATVIGDIDATSSDMLSTALFVMGFEKAKAYVAKHPRLGVIFVTEDGRVRTAGNLKGRILELRQKI